MITEMRFIQEFHLVSDFWCNTAIWLGGVNCEVEFYKISQVEFHEKSKNDSLKTIYLKCIHL